MSGDLLLVLATAAACINAGLHWYTHVSTYPLFVHLPPSDFVAYHREYQRRLPFSIYVPYALVLLTAAPLAFRRPLSMPAHDAWLVIALHLSITAVSVGLAVPLHVRLDRDGNDGTLVARLVRVNGLRLVAALLACAILLRHVMVALHA